MRSKYWDTNYTYTYRPIRKHIHQAIQSTHIRIKTPICAHIQAHTQNNPKNAHAHENTIQKCVQNIRSQFIHILTGPHAHTHTPSNPKQAHAHNGTIYTHSTIHLT